MGVLVKSDSILGKTVSSLAHLLFPELCLICGTEISSNEKQICLSCLDEFPKSKLTADDNESPLQQLFWGRVKIENVYSWLVYSKESSTKTLLHQIKYKDNPHLARAIGTKLGKEIADFDWVKTIDAFIPVPIHPKKEFVRGYNQSEELAKGIKEIIDKPIDNLFLKRTLHTESQTKKGRFGRWDNIENAFRSNKNVAAYKHIAIVDDVITTGATMERIIHQIHKNNPELRVSLISLAFAQ
jgi:ComF family protein